MNAHRASPAALVASSFRPVHLYGFRGDSKSFGNLFGCGAVSYQQENLSFPLGNRMVEKGFFLMKSRFNVLQFDHLMATNPTGYGCKQFISGKWLGQVVVSSGRHPPAHILTFPQ